VWITGILGTLITLILSPWLSELTFGNREYTLAFVWISITLLFSQLTQGQFVILQGLRKLQYLAKANITGSTIGLFIIVPLYYWFGIDAIVPVIIATSFVSLMLSWYFANKVEIVRVKVSRVRTIAEGKNMLIMGFMISLSGLIGLGTAYIVRIYISNQGGLADVGLYGAAFAIINTYVGLVFNAMGTDYYPRLSSVAHSNELSKQTINQQTEIALLILGPFVIIFLIFIKWVVILLYSNNFTAVDTMIHWAILGVLFKALSWALGIYLLAKGVGKLYFWNAILFEVFFLSINILGYKFGGLTGLGISYLVGYLFSALQVFIVCKIKYKFSFSPSVIHIFSIQFILAISSFVAANFLNNPYPYLLGVIFIAFSTWYSYNELDKRLGIISILMNFKNKFYKK
jgi:O-antigen/teichoic acid export membrane protein